MKYLLRFLIVLLLLAAAGYLYLNMSAGEFKTIDVVEQGECTKIDGVPGTEDIDLDRKLGVAFLSSNDRAAEAFGRQPSGGIYAWNTNGKTSPRLLTSDDPQLRPHGISLVQSGGVDRLFVVDHRASEGEARSSVRVYDWDGRDLTLQQVYTDQESLVGLNDVAGLADGTFYATNDHGSRGGLGRAMEDLLRVGGGSVVYYDGQQFRTVAEGVLYANGIAVDEDDDLVYVASTTTGKILVYDRDDSGDLLLRETIETGTGVDNIELGVYGNLWVAGHPKLLSFTKHARDPNRRSPSEALWIAKESATVPRVRTLWRNLGEQLSGSSVVVPVGARLLIGSVFEPHILICERAF